MDDNILELSTGVKLKVIKPSLLALREVEGQINKARPKPPIVMIEEKGREEPNENDPDYLKAVEEWQADGTVRQYNVAVVTGTEIEEIPEGILPFDSEDWYGIPIALGFEVGKTKQERYSQWIKYVAGPSGEDFAMILVRVLSVLGIREEVVAQAIDSFRGNETGSADNVSKLARNDSNGDTVRTSTRRNRTAV